MNPAVGQVWTIGQGTIDKIKEETGLNVGKEVVITGVSDGQFDVKDVASGTAFTVSRRQLGKPVESQPAPGTTPGVEPARELPTNINPAAFKPVPGNIQASRVSVTRGQATFPGREPVAVYAVEYGGQEGEWRQVFLDKRELFKTLDTLI